MSIQFIKKISFRITLLFLFIYAFQIPTHADNYGFIVCGSGGEQEYQEKFAGWGKRLRNVLIEKCDFSAANLFLLTEFPDQASQYQYHTDLDIIRRLFFRLKGRITNNDNLCIFLIGHGSYLNNEIKLHIPRTDLTATELNNLAGSTDPSKIILLNTASCSAGFINVLSGENSILCTATKSVDEINATEYMEFFIQGLEEGNADTNRDERISFLEACRHAAELTLQWYENQGIIPTEHAILDDNGDGLGTRLVYSDNASEESTGEETAANSSKDGQKADQFYLKNFSFPKNVPQQLIDTYVSTIDQINDLKSKQAEMDENGYYKKLESLLILAAKTNRTIHQHTSKDR